jgi:hypothetical protein
MSLEANITELTKAVNALVVALNNRTAAEPQADPADLVKRGPGRLRKDAQPPAAAPAPAPTPVAGPVNEGDPEGTTYWLNEKHNSVYRIVPGDGTPGPMAGSVQIGGADFLAKQSELAARFASLGNAPAAAQTTTPAPAAAPTPAASAPTAAAAAADAQPSKGASYEQARAALLALVKAKPDGRDLVLGILSKHGANSVPELASKGAAVFDAVVAEVKGHGVSL